MEGKPLPGGLSAGNAFPLHEASASWLVGRERLPAMYEEQACKGSLPAIYEEGVEGKPLPGSLSSEKPFPLYIKKRRGRKPLPGGLSAENAFPLYVKNRHRKEASARWSSQALWQERWSSQALSQTRWSSQVLWQGGLAKCSGKEGGLAKCSGNKCGLATRSGKKGGLAKCFGGRENAFPLYMKKLPGDGPAESAFLLYMKKAWKGSLCSCRTRRECLPSFEEGVEGKPLPGGLSV